MIENIELSAFIKENLSLARTIVIKNEDIAILDNTLMYQYQRLSPSADKSQWRYYLNLNGEYHSTDEIMFVRSLDDNENIAFTKANLELHPATKKAYRLGSYYFSRLVALYPHQMELIQGIINPIPPEESIPAKNYQILRYTKDYVLWNESQLIPELQKHIDNVVYQSFGTEYKYTDDLMLPLLIAHLHESIFKFLLQCRFENRYTRHAHSFYIWSHLQSKGISPIYKDLLNNKQTLWLFRNIDYVLRNLGKESTFKQLIDILLTERNIPIAKYDLIQSTENMSENLSSEPLFYSERLNLIETRGQGQSVNKLAITMLKEIPEALDNELYYDVYLPDVTYDFTFGEINKFPTKILDSELVDTTNRKPETFFHVLNSELIYLAGTELYNINLDIEDPLSGIHRRMSVKDAVVLWHHLLNRYNGAECNTIPQFYYKDVLRKTPPTVEEMLRVGSKPFLTEAWCNDVLKLYIPQIRIISPSTFYENSLAIFNLKWKHKKMVSRWLSIGYYSRRKNAVSTLYQSGYMTLTSKTTYSAFLEQYDYDFSHYRKEDYFSLMWEIWRKATGWDQYSHTTIAQIQEGMIGLMKFLSSYTVQFIHQTKIEDGWYEGGIDLFTENPALLNPNGDGQPELENAVNSSRIPVHHKVVMVDNEEAVLYALDDSLYAGTLDTELEENGEIHETPNLYNVELPDTDKDDGFHASQVMNIDNKLRNFTGELPYNLEDFIPKGGDKFDQHTLKELIVDTFEGITHVGPWKAIGINIVNNRLDNGNVAETVENYHYEKVIKTTPLDEETNRYYIGFSPKEIGEHVIKLDILIQHTETEQISTIRFDYNTVTKQNTWMVTFDIPQSVLLNTPFDITPTITGLPLGRSGNIKETYVVDESIKDYLSIEEKDGKVVGTFLKRGWPDELPVLYILTTTQDNDDPDATRHTYFMKGLIPSDRYYDPLTDPLFEPKIRCNEADINAITLENFSVATSSHGWEATNLYLKKNDKGQYPAGLVKTDYNGIVDFLSPTLSSRKFVDEIVNGESIRTFEWYYAADAENIVLDMVLELTNKDDGNIVLKPFTYSPLVVDHGAQCALDILPKEGFKFGINYSTDTALKIKGMSEHIVIDSAEEPVILPNQEGKIAIDYYSDGVKDNVIYQYSVKPYALLNHDLTWAIKLQGMTKTKKGIDLIILPFSTFSIAASDVIDYDAINQDDLRIVGWENHAIYAHAIVPTRYRISTLPNGWTVKTVTLDKPNGQWPAFVGTTLPGLVPTDTITLSDPSITVGFDQDGTAVIPEGYHSWFTIYMLGNRDTLNGETKDYAIPITVTVENAYSNKTKALSVNIENTFIPDPFPVTKNPDTLMAETDNSVEPVWENVPFAQFDSEQVSSQGLFLGTEKYVGNNGQGSETQYRWDALTNTGHIILPEAPISNGNGIRVYNERVYKSRDEKRAQSSLENVIYYPYVDYTPDEIIRIPVPTEADMDFTDLGNVNFYQHVRSSYVTLFNQSRLDELNWHVSSVSLAAKGSETQDTVIVTSVNEVDLTDKLYEAGILTTKVNDTPEGKENYRGAYVSFVPAVSGKQTFVMVVDVVTNSTDNKETVSFKHEIVIDVKDKEAQVVYDKTLNPEPFWAIGQTNYHATTVEGISDTVLSSGLLYAAVNDTDKVYVSAGARNNPTLKPNNSLAVGIVKAFSDITPKAVVVENVIIDGYATTDPRRKRYYIGVLDIDYNHLYNLDDINLDSIDFKEDVVWDEMRVNESYYERYVYNINTKGWTIRSASLIENPSWMNSYYVYDGKQVRDSFLININKYNLAYDALTKAPDDKQYYLPFYGGRLTGSYPIVISIIATSKHFAGGKTKSIQFRKDKKVVDSDIAFNLTYSQILIGKNNTLLGGMEGTPAADINPAMLVNVDNIRVIGNNASFFTFYKNPYKLTVKDTYPEGKGSGIMLTETKIYSNVKSGMALETNTWIRGYRGECIIPESAIITPVEYPDIAEFDFTPLDSTLYQGVSCALALAYKSKELQASGWDITFKGLKEEGTDLENTVMLRSIAGGTIPDKYAYVKSLVNGNPDDLPSGKDSNSYTTNCLRFIPAKAGKQTLNLVFTLTKSSNQNVTKDYVYEYVSDVKENACYIDYDDTKSKDPRFLVGDTTKLYTKLYNQTESAISDLQEINLPIKDDDLQYLKGSMLNTTQMGIEIIKAFDGIDRAILVGRAVKYKQVNNNDDRYVRYYFSALAVKASSVLSLDDFTGNFINFTPEIVFEEMATNQTYYERFIYDAEAHGWEVTDMKLVSDSSWMNHYFEYEGSSFTNSQLIGVGSAKNRYDKNNVSPQGKYYFIPCYGGRFPGTYELSVVITVTNNVQVKTRRLTFTHKFTRTVVDKGIGMTFTYDPLVTGQTVKYSLNYQNVPTSDLTPGVIANNSYYKLVGPEAGYFTLDTSKGTLAVDGGYPVRKGKGVKVTGVKVYRAVQAGSPAQSLTDYRAYRGEVIIPDSEINK